MSINTQIESLRQPREIKQYEQELLALIKKNQPSFRGRMLDIGCATGIFLGWVNECFPKATYVGLDLSADLIGIAKQNQAKPNFSFVIQDALSYAPPMPFDLIVAAGVMNIYDDFMEPLKKWLSWLVKGGTLYIFNQFNSRDIDTRIQFRNNVKGCDWEGGLTSYSMNTVGKFLASEGYKFEFRPFKIQMDIEERPDPARSFTVTTSTGERIVVIGGNIIAEMYFLVIQGK